MKRISRYLPLIVLLLGIGFRWYGVNWALPNIFHPDETRLLYAMNDLSFKDGDFNPDFFAYGSLPIYLLKLTYETAKTQISPHVNFFVVGRSLSALWGSLTLVLLYLFGRRFFSKRVALLSTSFLAFTVLHIQLSHFLTVDVFLTFLVVFALYWMSALANGSTPFRHYLLSGIAIGLAMATKFSALPLYGAFLGAHLLLVLRIHWNRAVLQSFPRRSIFRKSRYAVLWLWGMFVLALLVSGLVFAACQPYALLDFQEFARQIKEQGAMVRGVTQPPYTIQYEGTSAYFYPLQQLLLYSMGLPLGLLALLGTLFLLVGTVSNSSTVSRNLRDFPKTVVIILLWVIPVFIIVGGFKVKFLRYMLPLIPFLCVLGAVWIEQLLQRFVAWRVVLWAVISVVIGYSVFYSLAFLSIYTRDDPRAQMSQWIYAHVEPGATVLTEMWEFVSLVPRDGHHPGQYHTEGMDLYGPDTEQKLRKLARQLSEADAVILATKRLYGSIWKVPQRYPLTSRYYQQLFNGTLGFGTAEVFVNYPSLFGITLNDDVADESFSVYEHPKTIVFQKTAALSAEEMYQRIVTAPPLNNPKRFLQRLLVFPAREDAQRPTPDRHSASTVTVPLDASRSYATASLPAAMLWLAVLEIFALLALPYTMLLFRYLPDAGYSAAKAFGLLLPGYSVWLLVSLDILPFHAATIWGVVGALSALSVLLTIWFRAYYLEQFRQKWRIFLVEESVFLLIFGGFLLFRAYNPDIFWSESSMDFSFLNVLVRTDTFPPPDPWFAGAPLNYYYFGHYLIALLTRFTGIAPHISYNLAFACIPAIVAAEVFSVLYNLTRQYVWGWCGMLFATILGNLDGFFLLLANWRTKMPTLDAVLGRNTWLDSLIGTEHYYRIFRPAHEVIRYTVHEFPFWTFIFVDLHAHLLNMPFLIAAFLVGLNLLSASHDQDSAAQERVSSSKFVPVLSAALIMLLLGTLGVISSWDYPTATIFLVLCSVLLLVRSYSSSYHTRVGAAWRALLLLICVIVPGSFLLYRPFYSSFSRSGMGLGWVGSQTTELSSFFTLFGFFLWLTIGYLLLRFYQVQTSHFAWIFLGLIVTGLTGGWALLAGISGWNYATLLFVLGLLFLSSYLLFRQHILRQNPWDSAPSEAYITLCVLYSCLIVAGCEIVFVRDFLQGCEYKRMNTIFKFYLPVWYLLAFAAAYGLSRLWQHARQHRRDVSSVGVRLVLGGATLLFLLAAVFPVVGSYSRRQSDFYGRQQLAPTLNGLGFLAAKAPDEYRAIMWLNEHVGGTPTILEAVHDDYRYDYARISANTGLPAVLGWPSHADQREHWGETQQRRIDVADMYNTLDVQHACELLQKYQVRYVYIGKTERRDFTEAGLQKFYNSPNYFSEVFRSGETVIYEVRPNGYKGMFHIKGKVVNTFSQTRAQNPVKKSVNWNMKHVKLMMCSVS